jgi:hypothetical protein
MEDVTITYVTSQPNRAKYHMVKSKSLVDVSYTAMLEPSVLPTRPIPEFMVELQELGLARSPAGVLPWRFLRI